MNESMMQELVEQNRQGNRLRQRISWMLLICIVLLLVLVFLMGAFAAGMQGVGESMEQVRQLTSKLDADALQGSLQQLEQQLSRLDVDSLNETLAHASEAAQHLEKAAAGFEEFGQAMGNLFKR